MKDSKFWFLAFLVASVAALGYRWQANHTKSQLLRERFHVDSLQAVNDTQRVVFLRDLRITERRVAQAQLQRDSIDRLLKLKPKAGVGTTVVIRSVDTVLLGTATDTTGREATFQSYTQPYTIVAQAKLPQPPETPSLALAIRLDTIPVGLKLGCRPGKPLQTAHAAITSPIWASVNLVALTQDPSICNPPKVSGFRVPILGMRVPWWGTVLLGAVVWEVVR